MIEIIHWLTLIAGTFVAYIYFRDLGDVTQMVLNVKRSNVLFAIRYENYMLATSITHVIIQLRKRKSTCAPKKVSLSSKTTAKRALIRTTT